MKLPTERDFYPRFIARPPAPPEPVERDPETQRYVREVTREEAREIERLHWGYERSWTLGYDWSYADQLKKGWQAATIRVGKVIQGPITHGHEEGVEIRRAERARHEQLADTFIETGSFLEGLLIEEQEAVLRIVAERLRNVMADDFLTRSLLAASPVRSER